MKDCDTRATTPILSSELTPIPSPLPSDQEEVDQLEVGRKFFLLLLFSFPQTFIEIGQNPQSSAEIENKEDTSVVKPQKGNRINKSKWTPIATTTDPKPHRQKFPKPVKYEPWTPEWQGELHKKLYPPKKTKNTKTTKKKSNSNSLSSLSPEYITKNNAFPP